MKLKKKKTLPLSRGKILVKNYLKNIPRKYCFQESYFLKIDTKHGRLRLQIQDSEKTQTLTLARAFSNPHTLQSLCFRGGNHRFCRPSHSPT